MSDFALPQLPLPQRKLNPPTRIARDTGFGFTCRDLPAQLIAVSRLGEDLSPQQEEVIFSFQDPSDRTNSIYFKTLAEELDKTPATPFTYLHKMTGRLTLQSKTGSCDLPALAVMLSRHLNFFWSMTNGLNTWGDQISIAPIVKQSQDGKGRITLQWEYDFSTIEQKTPIDLFNRNFEFGYMFSDPKLTAPFNMTPAILVQSFSLEGLQDMASDVVCDWITALDVSFGVLKRQTTQPGA